MLQRECAAAGGPLSPASVAHALVSVGTLRELLKRQGGLVEADLSAQLLAQPGRARDGLQVRASPAREEGTPMSLESTFGRMEDSPVSVLPVQRAARATAGSGAAGRAKDGC